MHWFMCVIAKKNNWKWIFHQVAYPMAENLIENLHIALIATAVDSKNNEKQIPRHVEYHKIW